MTNVIPYNSPFPLISGRLYSCWFLKKFVVFKVNCNKAFIKQEKKNFLIKIKFILVTATFQKKKKTRFFFLLCCLRTIRFQFYIYKKKNCFYLSFVAMNVTRKTVIKQTNLIIRMRKRETVSEMDRDNSAKLHCACGIHGHTPCGVMRTIHVYRLSIITF